MLAEERFSQILALLAEKRTATVQELCEALNVSESTIRRWAGEDAKKAAPPTRNRDYSVKEDETV